MKKQKHRTKSVPVDGDQQARILVTEELRLCQKFCKVGEGIIAGFDREGSIYLWRKKERFYEFYMRISFAEMRVGIISQVALDPEQVARQARRMKAELQDPKVISLVLPQDKGANAL